MTSADSAAERLRDWLRPHRRVFVLTGAGISTGSGIPHYRDENGAWQRKPPIDFRAFTGDERARSRYWARSFVGWPGFDRAQPNAGHRALARWQQSLISLSNCLSAAPPFCETLRPSRSSDWMPWVPS